MGKCYLPGSRASVFSGVGWTVLMLAGGGSVFCGLECMGTVTEVVEPLLLWGWWWQLVWIEDCGREGAVLFAEFWKLGWGMYY